LPRRGFFGCAFSVMRSEEIRAAGADKGVHPTKKWRSRDSVSFKTRLDLTPMFRYSLRHRLSADDLASYLLIRADEPSYIDIRADAASH
jgi:hypothetical protein